MTHRLRTWAAGVCILLAGAAGSGAPGWAQAAEGDLLLGRYPALMEGGRRLAQLTLKDVLTLAMERNLALQANQASQGAAGQALRAAQERLQPVLAANLGTSHAVTAGLTPNAPFPASPLTSFMSLLGQDTTPFSTTLSQQDWLGNSYALSLQDTRVQSRNLSIPHPGDTPKTGKPNAVTDIGTMTGSATLPLAQNQGRAVNRVPVGQAEVGVRLTRTAARQQEQALLNAASQAYWNLVGQLQNVAVIEQAVQLDRQLLQDNEVRVRAGTRVPSDVQATQTQLAVDRRNLIQAQLQAQNLEDQLRAALGLDTVEFGIRPTDVPSVRPAVFDAQEQLDRVFANSPALASLLASLELNSYDLTLARNAARPQVNLALSYSFLGISSSFLGGTQDFGQSSTQGNSAALNVNTPLFDRAGPATVERRLNEQRSLELQIRDQRTTLNIQLQNTLRNIRVAEEQIASANAAAVLARTQLDNEVKRLAQGRSTPFTVAQAQQQLNLAQQGEIAARIQFELNNLARLVLTGEVYGRFGLTSYAEGPGL